MEHALSSQEIEVLRGLSREIQQHRAHIGQLEAGIRACLVMICAQRGLEGDYTLSPDGLSLVLSQKGGDVKE